MCPAPIKRFVGVPTTHSDEATCGNCGYCVRGIAGLVCPECGADLREVGIITPNLRHPVPRYVKAIFWSLALPLGALFLSYLALTTILPFSVTRKVGRTIFCQAPFLNTTLQVFGSQRLAAPAIANLTPPNIEEISVWDQVHPLFFDVNLKTGAYRFQGRNGAAVQQSSGFNGAVIAAWLAPIAGANPNDPDVLKLCDQVNAALNEIAQGNANKFTPFLDPRGRQIGIAHPAFYFVVRDEPHPAVIAALCVFWAAVWLYGIRLIYRRQSAPGV
jgi:hypothetical protein